MADVVIAERLKNLVQSDPEAYQMLQELVMEANFYRDAYTTCQTLMVKLLPALPEVLMTEVEQVFQTIAQHPYKQELDRIRTERGS